MVKKSRRRMPRHIVLPNGMWRFVKGGSTSRKRTLKPQRLRPKTRRTKSMARRRSHRAYARHSRRGGMFGGGKIMRGLFPVSGVIAGALVGAGVATLQEKFAPQVIPYQGPVAGFILAGVPGAAGAFVRDMFKGGATTAGGGW